MGNMAMGGTWSPSSLHRAGKERRLPGAPHVHLHELRKEDAQAAVQVCGNGHFKSQDGAVLPSTLVRASLYRGKASITHHASWVNRYLTYSIPI
jgi:hypothetical protein